jgi:cyclopropane-fatty-acyl-phospholipid synthase
MWPWLLERLLGALIREGALVVHLPGGRTVRAGDPAAPPVVLRVADRRTLRRLVLNPDLALGEAYTDGSLTIDGDDLHGLLRLATRAANVDGGPWPRRAVLGLRDALRRLAQRNPAARARANVAHHYDLSARLYELFLDADRQYSCAYFPDPGVSLEEAQAAKKAHIARKLRIAPGQRVLDIGCGWGGMGLTLARDWGARVTGVTLSTEQHAVARARAAEAGLEGSAEFRLTDYRDVEERFDRIVSVGMFEHVGVPHYREYFRHVREKLADDGVALIHTIGRSCPPGSTNPWLARYIFPGGYTPAMSEVIAAIEKEGLVVTDVEVLRLHYAETLRHWYDRFMARIDEVRGIYDDRFCRMWRFYLVGCEMSFREGAQVVFQFQLARRDDAVPLTRDYLYPSGLQAEAGAGAEAGIGAAPPRHATAAE